MEALAASLRCPQVPELEFAHCSEPHAAAVDQTVQPTTIQTIDRAEMVLRSRIGSLSAGMRAHLSRPENS